MCDSSWCNGKSDFWQKSLELEALEVEQKQIKSKVGNVLFKICTKSKRGLVVATIHRNTNTKGTEQCSHATKGAAMPIAI